MKNEVIKKEDRNRMCLGTSAIVVLLIGLFLLIYDEFIPFSLNELGFYVGMLFVSFACLLLYIEIPFKYISMGVSIMFWYLGLLMLCEFMRFPFSIYGDDWIWYPLPFIMIFLVIAGYIDYRESVEIGEIEPKTL